MRFFYWRFRRIVGSRIHLMLIYNFPSLSLRLKGRINMFALLKMTRYYLFSIQVSISHSLHGFCHQIYRFKLTKPIMNSVLNFKWFWRFFEICCLIIPWTWTRLLPIIFFLLQFSYCILQSFLTLKFWLISNYYCLHFFCFTRLFFCLIGLIKHGRSFLIWHRKSLQFTFKNWITSIILYFFWWVNIVLSNTGFI